MLSLSWAGTLFWLAYLIEDARGGVEAFGAYVRFGIYRKLVFPAHRRNRVSLPLRNVVDAPPVPLAGVLSAPLLRNQLVRTTLALSEVFIAVGLAFAWCNYVYRQPVEKR